MKVKSMVLVCLFIICLFFPGYIFGQSSITLSGATVNNGVTIQQSDKIIYEFTRVMGASDTLIGMALPPNLNTFTVTKNGIQNCPIDATADCLGSIVLVTASNPGSLIVIGAAETPGPTATFFVTGQSTSSITSCTWVLDPPSNAVIQYVRAIPNIQITYDAEVDSGATGISLNASASTAVFKPATLSPAPVLDTYTWIVAPGSPGTPLNFTGTTTLTPTFNAPTVLTDTDIVFQLTVTDDRDGTPGSGDELTAVATITVTVKARQDPIDAVLLMDTSGSMGWHRTGSANDLTGGCCSRLASAKLAANHFIDRLATFASDSRLGVAIFPAAPAPASNPDDYGDRFAPASNLADSTIFAGIKTAIGGEANAPCGTCLSVPAPGTAGSPTGIPVNWNGTPTSYGLEAARTMLTTAPGSSGRSRIIVLLSDGAWNVGNDPSTNTFLSGYNTDGIKIYAVGMGTAGADDVNHTSLQNIVTNTNINNPFGFTTYNFGEAASEPNLIPFLEKIMGHMVSLDFSVDPADSIGPGQVKEHTALVTSDDSILSFTLSWESSQEDLLYLTVISPDGTRFRPTSTGNGYHNVTVDQRQMDSKVNAGEWKIQVKNPAKDSRIVYNYGLMIKSNLNMRVVLDKENYNTGDSMLLEARLVEDNRRLKGATVKVKVKKPEIGIGNWHYTHRVSRGQIAEVPDIISGEPLTPVEKKNYVLLQEQQTPLPKIITEPEIILNDEGINGDKYPNDGIYSVLFSDFNVPGIYKFQITADGETVKGQQFRRENEVQKYVDIVPDPEITVALGDLQIMPGGKSGIMTIRVTPFDAHKNFLGPGYGDKISITSSRSIKQAGGLEDMLDGTYQQQFILNNLSDDPRISINVRGVQIFDGLFSELKKEKDEDVGHTWELSLHAGYPVLHSIIDNISNPGVSGIIDFAGRINTYFSIELLLGCHYFFEDSSGSDFYWINTSVNGKISIPIGPVKIFINGGGGYYILEAGDVYAGWNAGGGLGYVLSQSLELEVGYNYHNVSHTLNNEFSLAQVGIRLGL